MIDCRRKYFCPRDIRARKGAETVDTEEYKQVGTAYVISFLSVSNQSSSLVLSYSDKMKASSLAISHTNLQDSITIPPLIALFLTGYEPGARTHTSRRIID